MSKNYTIWQQISKASKLLSTEEIVGVPTETVYGLAAQINSEKALRKIFEIKERPFFDPLIVHISSYDQLPSVTIGLSQSAKCLTTNFWPGPLTLVLPKATELNPLITSGLDTVGVRMPSHPFARRILNQTKIPFAAPSANKFGKTSPTTADHVRQEFGDEVFVLDGGAAAIGIESTVVEVREKSLSILRPGMITADQIRAVLNANNLNLEILTAESSASPGHTETHYMPKVPLIVFAASPTKEQISLIKSRLSLGELTASELKLNQDPRIAARELYQQFRSFTPENTSFFFVIRNNYAPGSEWEAIWNRIGKAATLECRSAKS
jgi:L-threonylcarbamoyladenylate synthase